MAFASRGTFLYYFACGDSLSLNAVGIFEDGPRPGLNPGWVFFLCVVALNDFPTHNPGEDFVLAPTN